VAEEGSFIARLPEQDRGHFRNLALIRPQAPTEGQLRLIENLSRTLASPRLLTLIARTPHWLASGPVLQALAGNEATPEPLRRDLELAVSLFDLMREMDQAPAAQKEERAEAIRGLYQQLPADLRPLVKHQAKLLARPLRGSGQTLELPALPVGEPDWETLTEPPEGAPYDPAVPAVPGIPREELLARAETTPILADLQGFLLDADGELRAAALRNPAMSEAVLIPVLPQCQAPELFEETYAEARWYFREPVREAMLDAPHCPPALARKLGVAQALVAQLEQGGKRPAALRRIICLFSQLDESEYQYLTYWAKRRAPNMLRVIKLFFDRLQRRRVGRSTDGRGEGRWVSLKERVMLAAKATQPDHLASALGDGDLQVFQAALDNPGLEARELVQAIPGLDAARAERVARHPVWQTSAAVCEALIHQPRLDPHTAVRLLCQLTKPRQLLDVLRDDRLPHLEVKALALTLLRDAYLAMPVPQRVLALRSSGGELLRHLAAEVLGDRETLDRLVGDRHVDPGILLRLARNRQAPREVLEAIAVHPVLMAHPAVMSELLLNPKTPREASSRIWGLLSQTEQQALLRSPHLPPALRHLD
jgi:hypothetical protein